MGPKVTPAFFYGSATAAAAGLALGLALHGPWEARSGGPGIWFSSAAAEELAHPTGDGQPVAAEAEPPQTQVVDDSYLPPTPQPLVRLQPDRYPTVKQAALEREAERVIVDPQDEPLDALLADADRSATDEPAPGPVSPSP